MGEVLVKGGYTGGWGRSGLSRAGNSVGQDSGPLNIGDVS